MHVHGPAHLHGIHGVVAPQGAGPARGPEGPVSPGAPRDELSLSDVGPFVEMARGLPEIREERVAELRAALAEGTYDVESKLDLAISRLLDEIG